MTKTHLRTVLPILLLMLSILSCDRFNDTATIKPTQPVDFSSMVGKSLEELTTMLGPPTPKVSCYGWELAEGELTACYVIGDEANKLMSSISYQLKPASTSTPDRAVDSHAEMMSLVGIDVEGKEAKEDRRGFFTYDISLNGKSCFVDVHPRRGTILEPRGPKYTLAQLYVRNPSITLYSSPDSQGNGTIFYEQQTRTSDSRKRNLRHRKLGSLYRGEF